MSLLKKKKKKKLRVTGGAAATQASPLRPQTTNRSAPCMDNCASCSDVRVWINTIAQREKMGLELDDALEKAWRILTAANPFPGVMGRVCPHPCEEHCNRKEKEGAVAINAMERFLGDYAIEKGLKFEKLTDEEKSDSVGVIGAGPAGLSFAYQMARRGYKVTVYEALNHPGGMLKWGIPDYRLPPDVLDAEVKRIADLGVEIKTGTQIGKDVSVEDLRKNHKILFVGIGAHAGRLMKIPGEEGDGVWTGTGYLRRVNDGEKIDLGKKVAVIGGGDTAVDAARAARRTGADVTILYRRTRTEMPAIDSEVEDAFKEDIKIEFLVAPVEVKRENGKLKALTVRKMELGEPDDSGRRRPVPIDGSDYDVELDSLIAAISQQPDFEPLGDLKPKDRWYKPADSFKVDEDLWAGGDVLNLGIAGTAIYHGRRSADAADAVLQGNPIPAEPTLEVTEPKHLKLEFFEETKQPAERTKLPEDQWLIKPDEEIDKGITKEQFLEEVTRCFSCGMCFGCERCWMYCTPNCFTKIQKEEAGPGNFYAVDLAKCDGCKKCADECPCGFWVMV
jgi:NADPH-dependent glutamate synthase beta subunit-like oxidoreductase/Pyruvate/2-oxoacid:ferredoxin oxidoreductase delta subunit